MKRNFKSTLLFLTVLLASELCGATEVRFVGSGSFQVNGDTVTTTFSRLQNDSTNTISGTLYLQLVASADNDPEGSVFELSEKFNLNRISGIDGRLEPGAACIEIAFTTQYFAPPFGSYYVFLVVFEFPSLSMFLDSAPATANPHTLGVDLGNGSGGSSTSSSSSSSSSGSSGGGSGSSDNTLTLECPCRYVSAGDRITIEVSKVSNNRPSGYSGTLKLKLYATTEPYLGGSIVGYQLTQVTLDQLNANHYYANIAEQRELTAPPPGTYYLTLLLTEYRDGEDLIMDYQPMQGTETFGGGSTSSSGGGSTSSSGGSSGGSSSGSTPGSNTSGGGGAASFFLCLLLLGVVFWPARRSVRR